jgi:hypothetical protein
MTRNVGREMDKSTPERKPEPTDEIYKKGGDLSPADALARDKSSIRKPIDVKK